MMEMYHISGFAVMIATNATMLMREWNEAEQATDTGYYDATGF